MIHRHPMPYEMLYTLRCFDTLRCCSVSPLPVYMCAVADINTARERERDCEGDTLSSCVCVRVFLSSRRLRQRTERESAARPLYLRCVVQNDRNYTMVVEHTHTLANIWLQYTRRESHTHTHTITGNVYESKIHWHARA